MIIIEGADCTGKTTLAEKLCDYYGHKNLTHYSNHDHELMLNHIRSANFGSNEIVDRLHLSEIPYSMYYRHVTPQYDSVIEIERERKYYNHPVILCVPQYPKAVESWRKRVGEELIKTPRVYHEIYNWYKDKTHLYCPDLITYDYARDDFDTLLEKLDEKF